MNTRILATLAIALVAVGTAWAEDRASGSASGNVPATNLERAPSVNLAQAETGSDTGCFGDDDTQRFVGSPGPTVVLPFALPDLAQAERTNRQSMSRILRLLRAGPAAR